MLVHYRYQTRPPVIGKAGMLAATHYSGCMVSDELVSCGDIEWEFATSMEVKEASVDVGDRKRLYVVELRESGCRMTIQVNERSPQRRMNRLARLPFT